MVVQSVKDLMASDAFDMDMWEISYRILHEHPELSNQEHSTSAAIVGMLEPLGVFIIHDKIGGCGLAAVYENGTGKTILLRADMDALPVEEQTGLNYASKVKMKDQFGIEKPVMHACGHDVHMIALLAAAEVLTKLKTQWKGTLILCFQPAEEKGTGAQAMVDDGLFDKVPVPDIVLGQHVMAGPAGSVGSRPGTIMASADSYKITLYGRGGHGSMPHMTIDPVMMATSFIQRVQTIVSRECDPSDMAVVTIGSLNVGSTENIISDKAEIGLDIRTILPSTREKVIASIKRMLAAEFVASGASKTPSMEQTRTFPNTVNDSGYAQVLANAFSDHFGADFNPDTPRVNASEDVSILATSQGKPYLFWFFGGTDPERYRTAVKEGRIYEDIPGNHSPFFAPVIQPTLRTGIETMCIAALTFFNN